MSNAGYQKAKNISKAYEMYLALLQDFMLDLKMAVNPKTDATIQFKELDFIQFGKHLCEGIAKQF